MHPVSGRFAMKPSCPLFLVLVAVVVAFAWTAEGRRPRVHVNLARLDAASSEDYVPATPVPVVREEPTSGPGIPSPTNWPRSQPRSTRFLDVPESTATRPSRVSTGPALCAVETRSPGR